ncbi:MAG: hypothetical protein HFI90_08690 [Clostridia bacterium]|nr:hypothetical protein [Clostridia bacterium]
MKEKIYTIPLLDAYQTDCDCVFCYLEDKIVQAELEYTLGDSMMEPDSRMHSNETGFCAQHLKQLYDSGNRLSLALMISTHMEHLAEQLNRARVKENGKKSLFQKEAETVELSDLQKASAHCVVCDKLTEARGHYIDVFYYLWEKEEGFQETVQKARGLCIHHMTEILAGAGKHLKPVSAQKLAETLLVQQKQALAEDIRKVKGFIDMFDYRNQGKDQSEFKEALPPALNRLRGKIL